jgi:tetratricopeptide (TPR) repeat protein
MGEAPKSRAHDVATKDKAIDRGASCYQRGTQLAAAKNFDYAHIMFAEAVGSELDNLVYVEAMLQNLRAKFPERRQRANRLFGPHTNKQIKNAVTRKAWEEVLQAGVGQLQRDPWNMPTLRTMAEACAALHYNEVELAYLKQGLDAAPRNVEINRHCARSLARMGQFDQAIACWHRVETLLGRDQEAAQAIALLSEERLKYPNGRPPNAALPAETIEKADAEDRTTSVMAPPPSDVVSDSSHTLTISPGHQVDRAAPDQPSAARVPWLEAGLLVAALTLVLQLFPATGGALLRQVDVSRWSGTFSFVVNLSLAITLVVIVFGTECGGSHRGQRWVVAIGVAALALQLWPWFSRPLLEAIDVRNWSQRIWFVATCVTLIVLLGVRFGPGLLWRPNRR